MTRWVIPSSSGTQLAVEEINESVGVNGRMLELIIVDDQSDAEEAVIQMERLHEDGVVAVAGTISSEIGPATTLVAEEAPVPLFLSKAGSSAILTADSRYTFGTCLPAAPMIAAPWAQYASDQGYTRIGGIITSPSASLGAVLESVGDTAVGRYVDYSCPDYFSESCLELARRYIAASGNSFMRHDVRCFLIFEHRRSPAS